MVRVKFFASFREITGKREIEIHASNLGEVIERICSEFPDLKDHILDEEGKLRDYVNIFVNGNPVKDLSKSDLTEKDEIAIFPPVSGGKLMKEIIPVDEALKRLLKIIREKDGETIEVERALYRVLAEDVRSPMDIPHYDRCAMDGFAVRSVDTEGASISSPILLRISDRVSERTCVYVNTGDALPEGADAVIKIEDTERAGKFLRIFRSVRPWENVGKRGEDVREGDRILEKGRILRPQDLAMLKSAGLSEVPVKKKPEILVVPTGNELVQSGDLPPGMVYESNGIMIVSFIKAWGGMPTTTSIVRDEPEEIERILHENGGKYDLIVFTGGTSVGERDHLTSVIDKMGELLFRGVGLRPGKPTLAGTVDGNPVLGLPGFPAACAVSAHVFLREAINRFLGKTGDDVRVRGRLGEKVVSKIGYRTYARVRYDFNTGKVTPLMTSGSGILSSMVKANGFVVVDEREEGFSEGDEVEVILFDF